jgi:cyclopropane fatty-acyl-phospholipid synthase-like methyltransferase
VLVTLSEACERNKDPILGVIAAAFASSRHILEIGSGTGQHAVHFARNLPWLTWQPTDTGEYLTGLQERIRLEGGANLHPALELDVRHRPWPVGPVDGVFSANTLHIMSWSSVQQFFRGIGEVLQPAGVLCIYGPFRYDGSYTSDSNLTFDRFLRERDPESGIRDLTAIQMLARQQGLQLKADHPMPANNQTLIWQKDPYFVQ